MNNETTVHKSLAAALLAAQRDISMLQKDATQSNHGYNYVSADGVISQTRAHLMKHGLVFRSGARKVEFLGVATETRKGKGDSTYEKSIPRAVVTITVTLAHADSGESFEESHSLVAEADTGRPIDKAIFGAETSMIGYALRGILNLPRFDNELEVSGRNDTEYDPKAIGLESAAELMAAMNRLGMSIQFVRQRAIQAGADEKVVGGKLATWPKEYAQRVQGVIDKYAAKQQGQKDAIKGLPQRKAEEGGASLDTSTSQVEPEPVRKPEPPKTPAPAKTPAKTAPKKTTTQNGKTTRDPFSASDDFAEEMARLL